MKYITNTILKGFNPDPSIVRVGEDYYIATSTFEWFPGVQIHHSKDLINWKLVAHPLNRVSQLDLKGCGASCGVWAPSLTYDKGIFYLIYTDMKTVYTNSKDSHNYLVTTTDILKDWSEPIYLNSTGFDPAMFHDEDGRKWLVNMECDHRNGKNRFGGIILQEYSFEEKSLVGEIVKIFSTGNKGLVEAGLGIKGNFHEKDCIYYKEGGLPQGNSFESFLGEEVMATYLKDNKGSVVCNHIGKGLVYSFGFYYGYSYSAKIAPHVPIDQKNNELYPIPMMKNDVAKDIINRHVKPRSSINQTNLETAVFDSGIVIINHSSYPVILKKLKGIKHFQYPVNEDLLLPRTAVFIEIGGEKIC